jgi:hypothetical protein
VRGANLQVVQDRLRRELDARNGVVRELARDISVGADVSLETARRTIYRILNDGDTPKPTTSAMLERGLDQRAGYFTVEQTPNAGNRRDRQAKLEEEVGQLRLALDTALQANQELVARVEALEQASRRAGKRAAGASPRAPRQR